LPIHPSQKVRYPLAGRVTITNDVQYAITTAAQPSCHHACVDEDVVRRSAAEKRRGIGTIQRDAKFTMPPRG
jgi:hypothetical protein